MKKASLPLALATKFTILKALYLKSYLSHLITRVIFTRDVNKRERGLYEKRV